MKKNVFLTFAILLAANFSLYAQTEQSIVTDSTKVTDLKFYNIENYTFLFDTSDAKTTPLDFNINLSNISQPYFQKYNNISMLTNFYENNNDGTYTFVSASRNLENLFRGVKIDSYNPRGMSTNGKSIIFGVFGTILDKIQN